MIFGFHHGNIFLSGKCRHHTKVINYFNLYLTIRRFIHSSWTEIPSLRATAANHVFCEEDLPLLEKQLQAVGRVRRPYRRNPTALYENPLSVLLCGQGRRSGPCPRPSALRLSLSRARPAPTPRDFHCSLSPLDGGVFSRNPDPAAGCARRSTMKTTVPQNMQKICMYFALLSWHNMFTCEHLYYIK